MGISATQLQTFDDCPYKYYLHYVEKLKPMLFDIHVFDVGTKVHDAIDKYYRTSFGEEKTYEEILYEVYHILRDDWDRFLAPELLKKAYGCIENFASFESKRLKHDSIKPLTELKIPARGYYGIVDFYNPATQKPIDWKTSKYPSLSRSYKIQAQVYKILLDTKFNLDLDKFYFSFLKSGVFRKVDLKSKKMDEFHDFVIEGKDEIIRAKKLGVFEKKPRTPKMCKWCDYRYYCKDLKI